MFGMGIRRALGSRTSRSPPRLAETIDIQGLKDSALLIRQASAVKPSGPWRCPAAGLWRSRYTTSWEW